MDRNNITQMIERMKTVLDDSKIARQERDTIKEDYNKLLEELITTRNEKNDAVKQIGELKISLQKALELAQSAVTELNIVRDQRGKGKK
jgi:hypothetical protein